MNLIPKVAKAMTKRDLHKDVGGDPEKHVITRTLKLSSLLRLPHVDTTNGKVRLEVDMDLPMDIVFNKRVNIHSNDRLVMSSTDITHLNPIWSDGTPVRTEDLEQYELFMQKASETKQLMEGECGSCAVVPPYTASEFEAVVKRLNDLEHKYKLLAGENP